MRWLLSIGLVFAILQPVYGAQGSASVETRFVAVHRAMGTEFRLELYARDQASADVVSEEIFDEVDRLDDLLSNYKPQSELSRINREAAQGWVITDPETFAFLQRARYWSERSNGAFDITVGPLLKVWGFFRKEGRVPSEADLAQARTRIGWRFVELRSEDHAVRFAGRRQMELDPGSIGKGFAVDKAIALMRADGVHAALLSSGGSTVYALGTPPGQDGWPVLVPDLRNGTTRTLHLRDTSISTGACTEKFFVQAGKRYCHIFNPLTGRPVEGVLQSSVMSQSATDSDAVSTVVFVLPEKALSKALRSEKTIRALVYRTAASGNVTAQVIRWPAAP